MPNIGRTKISAEGMAYFGVQSPLLKAHNIAHFINKFLDIELAKSIDFKSYATEQCISFPCYIFDSEIEQCSYHLIGNKAESVLFSSHSEVDFWFLVQFENELNERLLSIIKAKLLKDLCDIEQVFSVFQAEPKKLSNHTYFLEDFLEHCTILLKERQDQNNTRKRPAKTSDCDNLHT